MKNVIIHIGLRKTGSTFLQKYVFPRLKDCNYIGPPFTYKNRYLNTLLYADSSLLINDSIYEKILKMPLSNTFISNEEFCGTFMYAGSPNRTPIAQGLYNLFPKAKIVVFLRGQYEIILSHYYQYIRNKDSKGILTLSDFIHLPKGTDYTLADYMSGSPGCQLDYPEKKLGINMNIFKYHELLKCYSSLFENVGVFLYEDLIANPKETIQKLADFCQLKIDDNKLDFTRKVNKTESIAHLVSIRRRNQLNVLSENRILLGLYQKLIKRLSIGVKKEMTQRENLKHEIERFYKSNNQLMMSEYNVPLNKYPDQYPQ